MNTLKTIYKVLGVAFFVGGLFSLFEAVGSVQHTQQIQAIMFRLLIAATWLISGYLLIKLHKSAIWGIGAMTLMSLLTVLYNQYVSGIYAGGSIRVVMFTVFFFFTYSKKGKLLSKK